MTYSLVPTKVDGDLAPSADDFNTYIKDNFAASVPDIFTAKGDLVAGTAARAAARLAAGANDTQLVPDSSQATGLAWLSLIAAQVYHDNLQQFITDTPTLIIFPTEIFDTGGDFASNTFTCDRVGYYLVTGFLQDWQSGAIDAGEIVRVDVYKNDVPFSTLSCLVGMATYTGTETPSQVGYDIIYLAAGDTLKFYGYQNTGGNRFPSHKRYSIVFLGR